MSEKALTTTLDTVAFVSPAVVGGRPLEPPVLPSSPLTEVLSKQYTVLQYTWTSLGVFGAAPITLSFPKVLWQLVSVQSKLNNYRHFKANVEVEIRLNANKMQSGQMLFCWAPDNQYGGGQPTNVYQASQLPHVIVDAGSSEPIRFVIPWRNNYETLKIANHGDYYSAIGTLVGFILTPLLISSTATVPNVYVNIYARFVDAIVDGPTCAATIYPLATFQSGTGNRSMAREQVKKSEKGVISGTLEAIASGSSLLAKVPMIGGFASVASSVAEIAGGIAKKFGFDKPISAAAVQPTVYSPQRDFPLGKGTDVCTTLALDITKNISTDVDVLSGDPDERDIYAISRIPSLIMANDFFDSTFAPLSNMKDVRVCPYHRADDCLGAMSYLMYVSQIFKYWRGDIKYTIRFVTSPYTTARVAIVWLPEEDAGFSVTTFEELGNVPSLIVDINGTTVINFSIPYSRVQMWCETYGRVATNATTHNGKVTIVIINPPVVSDSAGSTKVYYQIWHAAGENMQFNEVVGVPRAPLPDPPAEFQADMRAVYKNTFEPIVRSTSFADPSIVCSEKYGPLNDLLHRMCLTSFAGTGGASDNFVFNFATSSAINARILLYYFGRIFRYARGSIKWGFVYDGTAYSYTVGRVASSTYSAPGCGMHPVTSKSPIHMVDIPYSYDLRAIDLRTPSSPMGSCYTASLAAGTTVYVAAGDDFTFHVLMPPPIDWTGGSALSLKQRNV